MKFRRKIKPVPLCEAQQTAIDMWGKHQRDYVVNGNRNSVYFVAYTILMKTLTPAQAWRVMAILEGRN